MAELNTNNFVKFDQKNEQLSFVNRSVFAFELIKKNDLKQAKRVGKDAYQFALDNKSLPETDFGRLALALL